MSVSMVELIGGNFQDAEGNLLANGYLTMVLSADSEVNDSMICSGLQLNISLDGTGNVIGGQNVWGNDQLLPVNSYYIVTAYSANGQTVWGPNNQQVIGNGGTFDTGTWVPNSVISWTPAIQPVLLQTDGTTSLSNRSRAAAAPSWRYPISRPPRRRPPAVCWRC